MPTTAELELQRAQILADLEELRFCEEVEGLVSVKGSVTDGIAWPPSPPSPPSPPVLKINTDDEVFVHEVNSSRVIPLDGGKPERSPLLKSNSASPKPNRFHLPEPSVVPVSSQRSVLSLTRAKTGGGKRVFEGSDAGALQGRSHRSPRRSPQKSPRKKLDAEAPSWTDVASKLVAQSHLFGGKTRSSHDEAGYLGVEVEGRLESLGGEGWDRGDSKVMDQRHFAVSPKRTPLTALLRMGPKGSSRKQALGGRDRKSGAKGESRFSKRAAGSSTGSTQFDMRVERLRGRLHALDQRVLEKGVGEQSNISQRTSISSIKRDSSPLHRNNLSPVIQQPIRSELYRSLSPEVQRVMSPLPSHSPIRPSGRSESPGKSPPRLVQSPDPALRRSRTRSRSPSLRVFAENIRRDTEAKSIVLNRETPTLEVTMPSAGRSSVPASVIDVRPGAMVDQELESIRMERVVDSVSQMQIDTAFAKMSEDVDATLERELLRISTHSSTLPLQLTTKFVAGQRLHKTEYIYKHRAFHFWLESINREVRHRAVILYCEEERLRRSVRWFVTYLHMRIMAERLLWGKMTKTMVTIFRSWRRMAKTNFILAKLTWIRLSKARAISHWKVRRMVLISKRSRQQAATKRAIPHLLAHSWHLWTSFISRRRRDMVKRQLAHVHWQLGGLYAPFATWRNVMLERRADWFRRFKCLTVGMASWQKFAIDCRVAATIRSDVDRFSLRKRLWAWNKVAKGLARKNRILVGAISHWQTASLQRAWRQIYHYAFIVRKFNMADTVATLVLKSKYLRQWKGNRSLWRLQMYKTMEIKARIQNRFGNRYFNHWRDNVTRRVLLRRKMRNIIRFERGLTLRRSFNKWREVVVRWFRRHQLNLFFNIKATGKAMVLWQDFVSDSRIAMNRINKSRRTWNSRRSFTGIPRIPFNLPAFGSVWEAPRVVFALELWSMHRCMHEWRQFASKSSQLWPVCESIYARSCDRDMYRLFLRWRQSTMLAMAMDRNIQRTNARLSLRYLRHWHRLMDNSQRYTGMVKAAVLNWRSCSLLGAWNKWFARVRHTHLLRKAIEHMVISNEARCIHMWKRFVQSQKFAKFKNQKMISAVGKRVAGMWLAVAMDHWRNYAQFMGLLHHAHARWCNTELCRAFDEWKLVHVRTRAICGLDDKRAALSLAKAFGVWCRVVDLERRDLAMLVSATMHRDVAVLRNTMTRMKLFVRLCQMEENADIFFLGWSGRRLFEAWKFAAKAKVVIEYWAINTTYSRFRFWAQWVDRRIATEARYIAMKRESRIRLLREAYLQWDSTVTRTAEVIFQLQGAASVVLATQAKMALGWWKTNSRLLRFHRISFEYFGVTSLRRAWLKWNNMIQDGIKMRWKLYHAETYYLGTVMQMWMRKVIVRRKSRTSIFESFQRWDKVDMWKALHAWRDHIDVMKLARAGVRLWMRKACGGAFERWRVYLEYQRRETLDIASAAEHHMMRKLSEGAEAWRLITRQRRMSRSKLEMWFGHQRKLSFSRWRSNKTARIRRRSSVNEATFHFMHSSELAAFARWGRYVSNRRKLHLMNQCALEWARSTWQVRTVRDAFALWSTQVNNKAVVLSRMRSMAVGWALFRQRKAWLTWVSAISAARRAMQQLTWATITWRRNAFREALIWWRYVLFEEKRARQQYVLMEMFLKPDQDEKDIARTWYRIRATAPGPYFALAVAFSTRASQARALLLWCRGSHSLILQKRRSSVGVIPSTPRLKNKSRAMELVVSNWLSHNIARAMRHWRNRTRQNTFGRRIRKYTMLRTLLNALHRWDAGITAAVEARRLLVAAVLNDDRRVTKKVFNALRDVAIASGRLKNYNPGIRTPKKLPPVRSTIPSRKSPLKPRGDSTALWYTSGRPEDLIPAKSPKSRSPAGSPRGSPKGSPHTSPKMPSRDITIEMLPFSLSLLAQGQHSTSTIGQSQQEIHLQQQQQQQQQLALLRQRGKDALLPAKVDFNPHVSSALFLETSSRVLMSPIPQGESESDPEEPVAREASIPSMPGIAGLKKFELPGSRDFTSASTQSIGENVPGLIEDPSVAARKFQLSGTRVLLSPPPFEVMPSHYQDMNRPSPVKGFLSSQGVSPLPRVQSPTGRIQSRSPSPARMMSGEGAPSRYDTNKVRLGALAAVRKASPLPYEKYQARIERFNEATQRRSESPAALVRRSPIGEQYVPGVQPQAEDAPLRMVRPMSKDYDPIATATSDLQSIIVGTRNVPKASTGQKNRHLDSSTPASQRVAPMAGGIATASNSSPRQGDASALTLSRESLKLQATCWRAELEDIRRRRFVDH